MELSDGIDFEAWNATVRSLSGAVDRLERTAKILAAPPWMERLLETIGELNLRLERLENDCQVATRENVQLPATPPVIPEAACVSRVEREEERIPIPRPIPEPWEEPDGEEADEPAPHEDPDEPEPIGGAIPVRFGDPAAIAAYGRPRRR